MLITRCSQCSNILQCSKPDATISEQRNISAFLFDWLCLEIWPAPDLTLAKVAGPNLLHCFTPRLHPEKSPGEDSGCYPAYHRFPQNSSRHFMNFNYLTCYQSLKNIWCPEIYALFDMNTFLKTYRAEELLLILNVVLHWQATLECCHLRT